MWFWKKKIVHEVKLDWLHTDMHSHLIPGIDDGAKTMEESIELINGFVALGYKKIITTPHILWEMYPNTRERILNGVEALRQTVREQQIDVEVSAAAEYFIDEHFKNLLQEKAPLLTLKENLVLVEFSMITAPMDLQEVIFEMQVQNYQPIIAHPERYIYLKNKKAFFEQLKEGGAQFQLNLLSLVGYYGNSVQELAEYILKKGLYDYAATDLHGKRHLDALQKLGNSPLYPLLQESSLKNSLL